MKFKRKGKMKNYLLYLVLFSLMSFPVHALKLYLLSDHHKAGDHNQALGISNAIKKFSDEKIPVEDLNTKDYTASKIKDTIEKDLSSGKVIVVGAGEGGIDGLKEVSKYPNLIICLTSHMFLDQYKDKDLLDKVDFIALPNHISSEEKLKLGSNLIETTGVAHNRYQDIEIYDKWRKELPAADLYLGIYLGGDAPTQTKEMKLFSEEDTSRLANYVIMKVREFKDKGAQLCILVLNGPRTGKYDKQGKEILTVHRQGKSDHITALFEKKLANQNIKYKLFDFQYNTPENEQWVFPYNAFDLVLSAVKITKGEMIVPGESTSVVSEAIDVIGFDDKSIKVLVYENSAMNDVHKAHVRSELEAGRIAILDNYQDIITPESNIGEPKPSAAIVIAKKLLEKVKI